jgi:hypothetical protein
MGMASTDIWSGTVGGRRVTLKKDANGDLRVSTVTASDDEGRAVREGDAFMHLPPTPAGTNIDIDPDEARQLRDVLMEDGEFTSEEADEILSHLP